MTMNQDVKAEWVKALRSGEYKQNCEYSVLRTADNTFCCLGVLTDLAVKAGVLPEGEYNDLEKRYDYQNSDMPNDVNAAYLPVAVINWADVHISNPIIKPGSNNDTAAGQNDGGTSFSEIADLIEQHL